MAATKEITNRPEFKLDLSKVAELAGREDELKESIEREYSKLSITPRTFFGRDYISLDTEAVLTSTEDSYESVFLVFQELVVISSDMDIQILANELMSIGLITEGNSKKVIDLSKQNKEEVAVRAKPLLMDIAQKEFAKLEAGVNKFKSSANVISFITVDRYLNSQGKEVLKFGMNRTIELAEDIIKFNNIVATRVTNITASNVALESACKSNKSKGIEDTNSFIHFVELCLMKKAISEVSDGHPVLVETFARNAEGEILFDNNHKMVDANGSVIGIVPEVHVVLLYKMSGEGNNQILIIDPRNSNYTKHFVLGHNKYLIEQVTKETAVGGEGGISLAAPIKTLKIYKPPDGVTVGPAPNQARDYFDIAVKLAFEIIGGEDLKDLKEISTWVPILRVTNDADIDSIMHSEFATRIKQSSDDFIRSEFSAVMKKFYDLVKMVKSFENPRFIGIEDIFEDRLQELIAKEQELVSYIKIKNSDDDIIKSIYIDLINQIRNCLQEEIETLLDNNKNVSRQLYDFCRYNIPNKAIELLNSSDEIDLFYEKGYSFFFVIKNKDAKLLSKMIKYHMKDINPVPEERSLEENIHIHKLKTVIEEFKSRHDIPEEVEEVLAPFLCLSYSEKSDAYSNFDEIYGYDTAEHDQSEERLVSLGEASLQNLWGQEGTFPS